MTQPWTETDGRLLRTLRERSGIDRANFARRNTLSVGQLTELEEGGQGRFYNDAIKAHKGQTLLARLGYVAPPPAPPEPPADPAPQAQAMPPTAPAAPQPETFEEQSAAAPGQPEETAEATKETGTEPAEGWRAPAAPEPAFPRKAVGLALAAILVVAGVFLARQPQPVAKEEAPPPAPALPLQPADAGASAAVADAPSPPAAPASAPPVQAPEPAAPAVAPAAPASATASSTVTTDARCPALPREGVTQFTPAAALRPAGYVYIEAASEARVCVVDGRDRHTSAVIRPGAGVTVNGEAPFTLHTRQWGELRVFFQGARVNLAEPSPQAVTLTAR